MFICSFCHRTIGPGIHSTRLVVQRRIKRYNDGSEGWEIVKEKLACPNCVSSISAAKTNGRRHK